MRCESAGCDQIADHVLVHDGYGDEFTVTIRVCSRCSDELCTDDRPWSFREVFVVNVESDREP